MNAYDAVVETINSHHLLLSGAVLVVGVSGGTNSLALLHMLARWHGEHDVRLHVATLDHGLRGEAGASDARFVVETAQAWSLPVTAGSADVRALVHERGIGIEAAARIARYDFLASVARAVGAERVAVAHNADDQVETVLMHLLRGSGLTGLGGMAYAAPLPGHPDLTVIRPLLDVPRADLEAYCREHGLQPRQDATNEDISFTRNRLRREVIPHLREVSPQIERRLLQLAEIAALEDDYADRALHAAVDTHFVFSGGRISLPRSVFAGLHSALQRRFVVWAVQTLGEGDDAGYVLVIAAVDLALRGQVGARAQLKGGLQLRVDYETVVVERDSAPFVDDLPLLPEGAVLPLAVPGLTRINERWSLIASLTASESATLRLAVPDGFTVLLRGRRAGDRFAPLGLGGGTQKLSEWMIDRKVPRQHRIGVPLLVINGHVAAICWNGWTISEQFVVTPASRSVVYGV